MIQLPITNTSFVGFQQIAWDSTSIGAFKKCPYYYQLSIIEGWQPRMSSVHLAFGIAYHSATERYDHSRARGESHEQGVAIAIRFALQTTWDSTAQRPAAWACEDPNKNRLTLVRTLVWYLDQFENDPLETVILHSGKPAVELSFRVGLGFGPTDGSEYTLCGHMDRVAKLNGQPYVTDKKTTKHTLSPNYFDQYTPDNQMSTYSFAGRVVLGEPIAGLIIDAAQIAVTFSRFQRGLVTRTPEQLEEWYQDLRWVLGTAEAYAKAQYWPRNDKACFGCDFRRICSKSPSSREQWMDQGYVKRIWDPLVARGDI